MELENLKENGVTKPSYERTPVGTRSLLLFSHILFKHYGASYIHNLTTEIFSLNRKCFRQITFTY